MAKNIEKIKKIEVNKDPEEIVESIANKLSSLAKNLIFQNQDLSKDLNRTFFENPDDPKEHGAKWHQWGIITHTKMSLKAYEEEIPQYLDQWGLLDKIKLKTSEKIDNFNKNQLLKIAILFHDLGKFSERKLKNNQNNLVSFSFKNHEIASGKIIRSPEFSETIKQEYGLTDSQIEYVAQCAEMHFELGYLRDKAKKTNVGYTIDFVNSDMFNEDLKKFYLDHQKLYMEMGILFFADFLGKTDIRIEARTDQEIETKNHLIQQLLEERELNSGLIYNIKQLPINFLVVERYLKFWANL